MSDAAPIAVFCYNRPDHLRDTLASLMVCDGFAGSPIFVFGDGPKNEKQRASVVAAQAIARQMLGERANYHFSVHNKGLSRSIIDGVNHVTEMYGRVIVIEDDLALAPGFLTFMNSALDRYSDDTRVLQVSGHMFDVPQFADRRTAVMLPVITTWGWATWKRAWRHMDETAQGWESLIADRALRRRFNLDGAYDYTTMMVRQMTGARDSWGIRWYWSAFKANALVVYPPQTLVRNCGFDGSGSHGRGLFRRFGSDAQGVAKAEIDLPTAKFVDTDYDAVKQAVWRQNGGVIGKVVGIVKKAMRI